MHFSPPKPQYLSSSARSRAVGVYRTRQLRIEQVVFGRQGECVVRCGIAGKQVFQVREYLPAERLAFLFLHLFGKLVFHHLKQQCVGGEVQPFEQDAHGFLLCGFHRTSRRPFLLECFRGGFLPSCNEWGV